MNNVNLKIIGKRIKERRKELKITQDVMAEQLKITTFFISRIENGKSNMSIAVLNDICNYLDLDMADVVRGAHPTGASYLEDDIAIKLRKLNAKQKEMTLDMIDLFIKHSHK